MSDILVIGGGIAGLSAAARLSAHAQVTLIEAETALGYHASGRSAAMFEEHYGAPTVKALNHASAPYHHSANGGYLSPRGLLLVSSKGQEEAFAADCAELKLEQMSPSEACEMVPIVNTNVVTHAASHVDALDIDTDRMLQDFAKALRQNGGTIVTGAPATAIRKADQWLVDTPTGEHKAPVLVNAAGAWADQIAQMAGVAPIGLSAMRRSMARLPAPGGHDVSAWPMLMGVGESWYAKPDAGKYLVSPADEDPVPPQDAWADDMVLAQGLDRYGAMVTTPVTRVETSWAGLRTFAPDRTLVLGPDPGEPDFWWCAGQGGYGFQTAPAASQLLSDLITGAAVELDAATVRALAPDRLR
ncbi:MAG: NAD(P)/FAD-dependent oxidoreductase [Sedimentitalea sp.]